MANPTTDRDRDTPEEQNEPPRPHGDKLDDGVGAERTGDMDLPEMNPSGEGTDDQD